MMDPEKKNNTEKPLLEKDVNDAYSKAGVWSHLMFQWLNPLFEIGRNEKLEAQHIPLIPQSERADEASSLLEESLHNAHSDNVSLQNATLHAVRRPLAMNAVFAGVNTVASYVGPLLITSFVNFLFAKDEKSSCYLGVILAIIFFFANTLESLSQRQWYFGAQRIGVKIRAALTVLIYRKTLSMKYGGMSNGTITNLINVDVERIGDYFLHIHGLWLLPVQVILALVILYRNLGLAPSITAFCSTILVMVGNVPLAKVQKRLHSKIMESKDSRIKATAEMLKIMRVLKLHSWEPTFLEKLLQLRETERSSLKRYLYTSSAMTFLFWASPTLVSVATFGICLMIETPLTSSTILSALATFRILQEPIYNLPQLVSVTTQTKVSIGRIQEFINEGNRRKIPYLTPEVSDISIDIKTGEYSWDMNEVKRPTVTITENIKIRKGWKVAICGSVGAGKSSLLCSILGEIPRLSGESITTYGSKAFVPQSAWIQTGTIIENVLFGREMMKAFYDEVVEACALNRDIQMWADGDSSIVGERGINLSGGQKQRIQMARAIYSNSDIYLLDDPFSAVDAHTRSHMFKKCLNRLLHKKTVVYVTHQLEFLDAADLVLVMKDGTIVQSGKYEDLIRDSTSELVRQLAAHSKSLDQVNHTEQSECLSQGVHPENKTEVIEEEYEDLNRLQERTDIEEKESGRVKWHVYSTFITSAFKGALVPVILVCHILFQGLQIASNYWMAWATAEEGRVSKKQMIGIFALLSGGSSLFVLGRAVLLSTIAIETAQHLFLGMMTSVFRAPLSFFDSTPSSRILNRSSSDQSTVDTDIAYRIAGLAFAVIQLVSIIILMSKVAWPIFILFLVILAISIWYQAYYITTARELARMVGIQKAPILHHFSESIAGAATIRCFNHEGRFLRKNLELTDDYSRVAVHNSATMEWLCVRINFLFNFVYFILLIILVNLPRSAIEPSLAGLAATYGLNLNVLQAWIIWNFCNVENKIISVERILQFTSLPSEAPLIIESCRPQLEATKVHMNVEKEISDSLNIDIDEIRDRAIAHTTIFHRQSFPVYQHGESCPYLNTYPLSAKVPLPLRQRFQCVLEKENNRKNYS